jgi:hypothetical protein
MQQQSTCNSLLASNKKRQSQQQQQKQECDRVGVLKEQALSQSKDNVLFPTFLLFTGGSNTAI